MSGATGALSGIATNGMKSDFGRVAVSAALGGTAEKLGGGKFANGAVTEAYVVMFNDLWHEFQQKRIEKIYMETMYEKHKQQKTNWCAFVIAQTVGDRYGPNGWVQAEYANSYYGEHGIPYNSNEPTGVIDYMEQNFDYDLNKNLGDPYSFDALKAGIETNTPIVAGLKGQTVGHAILITGVSTLNGYNEVIYFDPGQSAPYSSSMSYSDYMNNQMFTAKIYGIR